MNNSTHYRNVINIISFQNIQALATYKKAALSLSLDSLKGQKPTSQQASFTPLMASLSISWSHV